jgi:hypothetical protein
MSRIDEIRARNYKPIPKSNPALVPSAKNLKQMNELDYRQNYNGAPVGGRPPSGVYRGQPHRNYDIITGRPLSGIYHGVPQRDYRINSGHRGDLGGGS